MSMELVEKIRRDMRWVFEPEEYECDKAPNRDRMWDLCLNYKIGKDDNVANHLGSDGIEPKIAPYSFQAFLYRYAVQPYFDPFNTLTDNETVDFHHIGDVIADRLTEAVNAIHTIAEGDVNKNNRTEVDGKCREIMAAKDVIDDVRFQLEHLVGSKDNTIKEDVMFGLAEDAFPPIRLFTCRAHEFTQDLKRYVEKDLQKFAEKIAPDRRYSFPQYQEEGTAKDIFINVRNGYYDHNVDALKEFQKVFEEEKLEHEAKYTETNIKYSEAQKENNKEAMNFFALIMDIEREKSSVGGFHRGTIHMEEYNNYDSDATITVNAVYDAGKDEILVYVNEFDDTGLIRSGSATYPYEDIRILGAQELEHLTNTLLYYAQEIEPDVERD